MSDEINMTIPIPADDDGYVFCNANNVAHILRQLLLIWRMTGCFIYFVQVVA